MKTHRIGSATPRPQASLERRSRRRRRLLALLAALLLVWAFLITTGAPADTVDASAPPAYVEQIELGRVTYYHAVPEQTDDDPENSACGPTQRRQIAVSRDLFRTILPCGTLVDLEIDGVGSLGTFVVWDTMARRWSGTADVLVDTGTHPAWGLGTGRLTVLERPQ